MARSKFNQSLALNPRHTMTLQLRGDLFYHSGEPALALTDFKVGFQRYKPCSGKTGLNE
ncbi:hypothetical protein DPMN_088183 [Dreissena polymorpha]|uniref:Uncharacterized protein n=1 Tax=Dreissena polymorpha TaxID=45954 RepID=A0A9D4QWV8_DREPO|nr:hypothetical protein DPMN_088183 [Dreissena polymorpha]